MSKMIGTMKEGLAIEDALKFDALERFRNCRDIRYGVNERTFDRIYLRVGGGMDKPKKFGPVFWLDAGRHTLMVTIDADMQDGQFTVEDIT